MDALDVRRGEMDGPGQVKGGVDGQNEVLLEITCVKSTPQSHLELAVLQIDELVLQILLVILYRRTIADCVHVEGLPTITVDHDHVGVGGHVPRAETYTEPGALRHLELEDRIVGVLWIHIGVDPEVVQHFGSGLRPADRGHCYGYRQQLLRSCY